MINITSFAIAKENGGGASGSTGFSSNQTVIAKTVTPVRIWGQIHDHNGDVNGDFTIQGNIIQKDGNITTSGVITAPSANINELEAHSITSSNATIEYLQAQQGNIRDVISDTVETKMLEVSNFASINDLHTNTLQSKEATIHNLTVTGQAHFFELVIDKIKAAGGAVIFSPADGFTVEHVMWPHCPLGYYLVEQIEGTFGGRDYIAKLNADAGVYYDRYIYSFARKYDTDKLYVILMSQSSLGDWVLESDDYTIVEPRNLFVEDVDAIFGHTPVNYFERLNIYPNDVDWNKKYELDFGGRKRVKKYVRLLWHGKDGEKLGLNMFEPKDQIICQNFNDAKVGQSSNVSNKYYWALVSSKGTHDYNVLQDDGTRLYYKYNFIEICGYDDMEGEFNPEPGDEIAMLGHRGDDEKRKSAIYISSYKSIDPNLEAPLFVQYEGIDSFNLTGKAKTYFARNKNYISGSTVITAGGNNIEDELNNAIDSAIDGVSSDVSDAYDELMDCINGLTTYTTILKYVDRVTKSYAQWKELVGTNYNFTCRVPKNEVSNWDVRENMYCFIEQIDVETSSNITLYGKITEIGTYLRPPAGGGISNTLVTCFSVKVNILMVLNGDLQDIYSKYAQLEVNQNSISATVASMNNGIENLTLDVDGLHNTVTDIDGRVGTLEVSASEFRSDLSDLENDMNSKIQQKADEIILQVNETMVNITQNEVVINSDTKIEGDLTLQTEGQGITIIGPNGETTQIKALDLGTYNNFSSKSNAKKNFGASTTGYGSSHSTNGTKWTYEFGPGQLNLNTLSASIGTFEAGQKMNIKDLSFGTTITHNDGPNGSSYNQESTGYAHFYFTYIKWWLYNDTNMQSYSEHTINTQYTDTVTPISLALDNFTIPETGNYYLKAEIRGRMEITVKPTTNLPDRDPYYVKINLAGYSEHETPAYMLISYNGFGVNFGALKTCFMGAEGAFFRYGSHGFAISESGIKKWDNSGQKWIDASL